MRAFAEDSIEVWLKPLSNNDWALCVLNRSTEPKEYMLDWQSFNLYDDVSNRSTEFNSKIYNINNLWTNKSEGTTAKTKKLSIPGRDVVLYRLSENIKNKKK